MCKLFFLEILTIWEVDAISLLWWLFNFLFHNMMLMTAC